MLKTACRNSKYFGFYRTYKIADLELEMYLLLLSSSFFHSTLWFPRICSKTIWASFMKFGMLICNTIPYGPPFTFFRNSYFWLIYAILKAQNLYINRRFSSPGFIQSPIELAQWNLVCAFVSSFSMDRDLLFFEIPIFDWFRTFWKLKTCV